jgi:hypothetical protein
MVEAVQSSKMFVTVHKATCSHIPEDISFSTHCCENLKPQNYFTSGPNQITFSYAFCGTLCANFPTWCPLNTYSTIMKLKVVRIQFCKSHLNIILHPYCMSKLITYFVYWVNYTNSYSRQIVL